MAIQIIGADLATILAIDATSQAARVTLYDTTGMRTNLGQLASYIANTGPITGATATGLKSLAYLWHPASVTKRAQILRIHVNQIAGSAGAQRIELYRITAENGTPGGSTATIFQKDPADAASGDTLRFAPTGAPTRSGSPYVGFDVPVGINGNIDIPVVSAIEATDCKPYICRNAQAEGWEIVQNVITTITAAPVFNITYEWTDN